MAVGLGAGSRAARLPLPAERLPTAFQVALSWKQVSRPGPGWAGEGRGTPPMWPVGLPAGEGFWPW